MEHHIENIMQSSMEHIKALADVNTVIGDPFMTDDDTMIVPVSKVSLGMLVGGGEYASMLPSKKHAAEQGSQEGYPFVGAATVGLSLTPLAFLAVQNDTVRVLPAKQDRPTDRLIDLVPHLIDTAERIFRDMCGCDDEKQCVGKKNSACKNADRAADIAGKAAEKASKAAGRAFDLFEKADDAAAWAAEAASFAEEEAKLAGDGASFDDEYFGDGTEE